MSNRLDALKDIRDVLTDSVYKAYESGDLRTVSVLTRELRATWAEIDEVDGAGHMGDVTPLDLMRREREERLKVM